MNTIFLAYKWARVDKVRRGMCIFSGNPLLSTAGPGLHACVSAQLLSCIQLFATPGTVALQAPLSMGFSRQEYWGGLPFPPPGDTSRKKLEK